MIQLTLRALIVFYFVLVLPGWTACLLLFAPGTQRGVSRIFWSIFLSIALACIVCVLQLKVTGTLDPALSSGLLGGLSAIMFFAAFLRWRRQGVFSMRRSIHFPQVGLFLIFTFFLLLLSVRADQTPHRGLTEFYLSDPQVPIRRSADDSLAEVSYQIHNLEGHVQQYSTLAYLNGDFLIGIDDIRLEDGQVWEGQISLSPSQADTGDLLVLVLMKQGDPLPYATLRLTLPAAEQE